MLSGAANNSEVRKITPVGDIIVIKCLGWIVLQVGRLVESGKGQATWFYIRTAVHLFLDDAEMRSIERINSEFVLPNC